MINVLHLRDLTSDEHLTDNNVISCLNRLLVASQNNYLKRTTFKNVDLIIGNSYQFNENGALTIPWNWDE